VLWLDGALDRERARGWEKSKAVSSHRSPRKKVPESHAEARRVGDRVPQLPKTFCGHEGVLESSGLTELGMESSAPMGKIQSGVKPPQSKKPGSGRNFWKMITFAPSRLRVRRFPLPHCSRLEAGGMAAHLFFDTSRFLRRSVQNDRAIFQRRRIG
jgi:hypothetical protein